MICLVSKSQILFLAAHIKNLFAWKEKNTFKSLLKQNVIFLVLHKKIGMVVKKLPIVEDVCAGSLLSTIRDVVIVVVIDVSLAFLVSSVRTIKAVSGPETCETLLFLTRFILAGIFEKFKSFNGALDEGCFAVESPASIMFAFSNANDALDFLPILQATA